MTTTPGAAFGARGNRNVGGHLALAPGIVIVASVVIVLRQVGLNRDGSARAAMAL
jgi:hypothetical protein